MKRIFTFCLAVLCAYGTGFAQTLDEDLKAKEAELAAAQEVLDGLTAEVDDLKAQIEKGAGWVSGYSGIVGFDFNKSNSWVSNPNPDASSSALNIALTGFANKVTEKDFWRNKGLLTKAWSDVDLSDADGGADDDGLFDNGTVDLLNLSSLYGRSLSDQWALSGLGEMNTSLGNFLNPGTLDIGAGLTWTPDIDDLVVVIHPINYHFAFSGVEGLESTGALGTKIRADFNRNFGKVGYTSTLTSFIPYGSNEPTLFEYTWINSLAFEIWQGIGVGVSFGLRNAEFETANTQSYYSVGLSYAL